MHVFGASLVIAALVGPFGAFGLTTAFPHESALSAQRRAVALIPAGARVAATRHLALPLSARRYIYLFPVIKDADWVAVDSRDDMLPNVAYIRRRARINVGVNEVYSQPKLMSAELRTLRRSAKWRLVYDKDGIYVFRRSMTRFAQNVSVPK